MSKFLISLCVLALSVPLANAQYTPLSVEDTTRNLTVEDLTLSDELITSVNVGTVTNVTLTEELGDGIVHHTILDLSPLTIAGNKFILPDGDKGDGEPIYTFPEGRILILGAAINATVTNGANFNASDDDHFYVAIGTADAGDDNDLTSTEADVIAKTTIDTAAGATLSTEWEADMTAGGDAVYDGTASAAALYANMAVEATDNSGANTNGLSGTLRVTWVFLGDD